MLTSYALVFLLWPAAAGAARHYEKVSPADKGGGDIVADGATTVASRLGDAVAFNSRTPFGDTIGSGVSGQTQFVARRADSGWVTRAITPAPRSDAAQVFFVPTHVKIYSEDLRRAVVWAYDLPAVSGDSPLRNNMYVEDTDTRTLEPVTVSQADPPAFFDFLDTVTTVWGVSADARHTSFVASFSRFLPEAAPGVPNVYQWDDGVLSLAGILPDGTVPPGGSTLDPSDYRGVMSADGTRLVFVASPVSNPQLYQRIAGTRTAWVSETELDPSDPNYQPDPSNVILRGTSRDGHAVFFTTDTPLVSGDTNGGPDLYRYTDSDNPSADTNLTMISQDGNMGFGSELAGISDDGERAYYVTSSSTLEVWDHGTTRLIGDPILPEPNAVDRLAVTAWGPGLGRATPDGEYFAFAIRSLVQPDLTGHTTNGHLEMYLYSLADDTVRCVSCPSGPATTDVTVKPAATSGAPQIHNAGFRPRFLTEDGRVFFSTAEPLASQDRNGVVDVYEYDPAMEALSLLSTGEGSDGTWFADSSASGDDVFVVTRQRLVASDRDDLVDVYDIRDGSTLRPEPEGDNAPACEGDACQPPPSASLGEDQLGSLTFDDGGGGTSASRLLAVRKRIALRGVAGSLRLQLFAPGRLAWRGKGLVSGSVKRSTAGSYRLRLRLNRRARAQLRASGTYRTSVRLAFVSSNGDEVRRTTRITFRAVAKKGR